MITSRPSTSTRARRTTGRGNVFSELDRAVQGTVKFRDGSIINICGKGTIIFSGRHSEHKVLTGVYWTKEACTC
jgi:hypothetical protein